MSDLVIESRDPRAREAELKDLFARNGKPEFGVVFDKAYVPRAEEGLRSWLGVLGDRAVMHISVTPLRFRGGGRVVRAGVLGDLMVDEGQRDFWGPAKLLRKLLSDVKRSGEIDVLVTTTTPDAESLFKAGAFKPFGSLRRLVLPLFRPYLTFARLKGRLGLTAPRARVLPGCDYRSLIPLMDQADYVRPEPSASYYDTRIPRAEFADGTWLAVSGKKGAEEGFMLVSRNLGMPEELHIADAVWSDPAIGIGRVALAAARWARMQRFRKLTITTLNESNAARQLVRAGFLPRDTRSTLLINRLTTAELPAAEQWFLPALALSQW